MVLLRKFINILSVSSTGSQPNISLGTIGSYDARIERYGNTSHIPPPVSS